MKTMDKFDLLKYAGMPVRLIKDVREFYTPVEYTEPTSLLLWGGAGIGKTTMAGIFLARELFRWNISDWSVKRFDKQQCDPSGFKDGKPVPTYDPDYVPQYPNQFVKLVDLFSLIKRSFHDTELQEYQIMEKYTTCDLLVLDDLGVEMTTPWNYTILYQLIDTRYSAMLPTIYTSNYSPGQLAKKIGDDRIISRIIGDCGKQIIEIQQRDMRIPSND